MTLETDIHCNFSFHGKTGTYQGIADAMADQWGALC